MNKIISTLLISFTVLLFTGCEKESDTTYGPLDGTVWIYTLDYYSSYFEMTVSHKCTLRFESTTFSIEYYSNYPSSPGVYATDYGIYETSNYPTITMVDDDGEVDVVFIDGDQLTKDSKTYYKQ